MFKIHTVDFRVVEIEDVIHLQLLDTNFKTFKRAKFFLETLLDVWGKRHPERINEQFENGEQYRIYSQFAGLFWIRTRVAKIS